MAYAIPRPATAFSLSPGGKKKRPRVHDREHLDFIRGLPSLVSGARPVEACHIRYGDLTRGKRETGMAEKPDDRWTVPLTAEEHRDQHSGSERDWWAARGIDPIAVALALYGISGDDEAAEIIMRHARGEAK